MGKLAIATSKYTIVALFDATGTVEKPDVIGAVFGQTEGLLGQDMDLRELQKTGRIGRIDVEIIGRSGKSSGKIIIPSSLDSSETALIAACIETIERVGPCNAVIKIEKIEDVRAVKRKFVVERAKELLSKLFSENVMETEEISEQIKESVRTSELVQYRGLPAGPAVEAGDSIIIVEGRADVLNLLKNGIKNGIAVGGTTVAREIIDLSKGKETTVFLDGDRGGDLILKELSSIIEIDNVARAPFGKEVEELTKKEIFKALREKAPFSQARTLTPTENGNGESKPAVSTFQPRVSEQPVEERENKFDRKITVVSGKVPVKSDSLDSKKKETYKRLLEELTGTRAAYLLNSGDEPIGKIPVKEVLSAISEVEASSVIMDGEVDQRLFNTAESKGIKFIVGTKFNGRPRGNKTLVLTLQDFS